MVYFLDFVLKDHVFSPGELGMSSRDAYKTNATTSSASVIGGNPSGNQSCPWAMQWARRRARACPKRPRVGCRF